MSKYSKEFKEEAIRLSDEIGNKKAAAQLGLPYYTLADWRNKSKHKPKEPELNNTELKIPSTNDLLSLVLLVMHCLSIRQ